MRAKQFLCFNNNGIYKKNFNSRIWSEDLASKINVNPQWAQLLSILRRRVCRCLFIVVTPIICGGGGAVSARYLFCFTVLCVLSSFAIFSLGKRELVALNVLCSKFHVTVIVL